MQSRGDKGCERRAEIGRHEKKEKTKRTGVDVFMQALGCTLLCKRLKEGGNFNANSAGVETFTQMLMSL